MRRSLIIVICCLLLCLLLGTGTAEEPANPEALVDRYVESLFYGESLTARDIRSVVSNPEGANAGLYQCLLPEIKKVAAGERESTVFTFSASQILKKTTLTAEDFGAEAFSELLKDDGLKPDAEEMVIEYIGLFDPKGLINLIYYGYPYDFYWYSCKVDPIFICDVDYTLNHAHETVDITGSYTLKIYVNADYRKNGQDFAVNNEKVRIAKASAENAKKLVAQYADLDDLEKLRAYKDWINDNVDYNDEAAGTPGLPYGDPWQLVWAFDNDPATKIVCEGFAKAFKYLCDLSTFRGDVSVIAVSGFAGGRHMWNIVSINGKNYLADITSCGKGTRGYPDKFFMINPLYGAVDQNYRFVLDDGSQANYVYDSSTLQSFEAKELRLDPGFTFVLPENTVTVEAEAFRGAEKLIHVVFPKTCTRIESKAFADCPNLVGVTIPNPDCQIAEDAFEGTDLLFAYCDSSGGSVFEWSLDHTKETYPIYDD